MMERSYIGATSPSGFFLLLFFGGEWIVYVCFCYALCYDLIYYLLMVI